MKKIFRFLCIFSFLFFFCISNVSAKENDKITLYLFHSSDCPHCKAEIKFLDEIEVNYTRWFADKLYNEHPHKYNMYGLKRMLDVYGVKTLGVHCNHADLLSLTYPCILHTHRNFVIGLDCNESITYLQQ